MMTKYRGGTLYKLTTPSSTALFQLTSDERQVWWAAPSIKHLERWTMAKVELYCDSKGWTLEVMLSEASKDS